VSNYKSFAEKVKKAKTLIDLKKLGELLTRLYDA